MHMIHRHRRRCRRCCFGFVRSPVRPLHGWINRLASSSVLFLAAAFVYYYTGCIGTNRVRANLQSVRVGSSGHSISMYGMNMVMFSGAVTPPVLVLLCIAAFLCILVRGKINIRQFLTEIFSCCSHDNSSPPPPPPPPPPTVIRPRLFTIPTKTTAKKIVGRYHFVRQENFEDYLVALGVPADKRQVVMINLAARSYVDCQYYGGGGDGLETTTAADDCEWYIHCEDGLRGEPSYKFRFGMPTPPLVTEDGRIVTDEFFCIDGDNDDEAVMAANGGGKNGSSSSSGIKIVQKERWQDDDDGGSNKEATITYEFKGNGNQRKRHCIMTSQHCGVSCVRHYSKEGDDD